MNPNQIIALMSAILQAGDLAQPPYRREATTPDPEEYVRWAAALYDISVKKY
jgi:hypothetical protein